jgi:hypothetical protein
VAVVVGCAVAIVAPGRAKAGDTEDARVYVDKATAAFALTHYAVAAENFEKAFELKPDPALLYNAAQAHRLAGNKERALALYKNYLRIYAKKDKQAEIQARIAELEKAIARDKAIAEKPPNTTEPVAAAPPPAAPPPALAAPPPVPAAPPPVAAPPPAAPPPAPSPPAAEPAPPPSALPQAVPPPPAATLVVQPGPPAQEETSLVRKPWFWLTVAGVVAAVTVVVVLASSGSQDPSPSIGKVNGN